ncbi:hypothetical protein ACC760_38065, partial [Rhizobium ruizarguesonis]
MVRSRFRNGRWLFAARLLRKRRDKRAAKRVLVALMKRYGFATKRIITDKLRSYGAAKAEV